MGDEADRSDRKRGGPPEGTAEQRKARLAAALRENLKKRKAQVRARTARPAADEGGSGRGGADGSGGA